MKKMLETSRLCCISFFLLSAMFACQDDENVEFSGEQGLDPVHESLTAIISDGLHDNWSEGDPVEEMQSIAALGAGASTKCYDRQRHIVSRVENVKSVTDYISRIDEMLQRKQEHGMGD